MRCFTLVNLTNHPVGYNSQEFSIQLSEFRYLFPPLGGQIVTSDLRQLEDMQFNHLGYMKLKNPENIEINIPTYQLVQVLKFLGRNQRCHESASILSTLDRISAWKIIQSLKILFVNQKTQLLQQPKNMVIIRVFSKKHPPKTKNQPRLSINTTTHDPQKRWRLFLWVLPIGFLKSPEVQGPWETKRCPFLAG